MTLPLLPGVSIALIQRLVASRYGVKLEAMTGVARTRDVSRPRQMAMYLAREFTRHSLPMIGRRFGGRDHTTVLHACRAVPRRAGADPETAGHLRFLRALLDQMSVRPVADCRERERQKEAA